MGNIIGVPAQVALFAGVLVVVLGGVMITLERIDQRTEALALRSEANKRKHDILGWTPDDLARVHLAWKKDDPEGGRLPLAESGEDQYKARANFNGFWFSYLQFFLVLNV